MSVSINNPNKPTQILIRNIYTKNPNYSKEPTHDKQIKPQTKISPNYTNITKPNISKTIQIMPKAQIFHPK